MREQNLSEEFISQFLAICLDDTSSVLPKRHTEHYPKQRRLLLPNWYSAIESLKSGLGGRLYAKAYGAAATGQRSVGGEGTAR